MLLIGQPVGSLQAVKDSLLRMRSHRDRLSTASSTSVTAHAGSSVRAMPTPHLQQQEDNSRIMCIANELIRYMLDDKDMTTVFSAADDKLMSTRDDTTTSSSDPCLVSIALQHQQLRAQVLASAATVHFSG